VRSVYAKILAWSLATLFISMSLFFVISRQLELHFGAEDLYRHVQSLELDQTVKALEAGGPAGAGDFISYLDRRMGGRHYILDAHGRDLIDGTDRSALAARLSGHWDQPIPNQGSLLFGSRTPDHRYVLIVYAQMSFTPWIVLLFNGLLLLTVAVLCWPLAFHIGSPLRALARVVERFGQGELTTRAQSARRDEIGNLARSFDRMADRIETLLTAERRLLQDVSHELRSPLARLSFATELVATEPDRDKALQRIRKEVSRLSLLVGSLLEMTRAEGDPATAQRKEFSLDEVVRDLVEDCGVESAARGCRIEYAGSRNVPLTGDRELVRRAAENVLRNAIRYSPEGATVDVQVDTDGGFAQIRIADKGPGVPKGELTRIFQPFYRVDDSRTAATGGVGLGLAIAMRAIRLHNGSIEARNLEPGFMVTIRIPLS
jgi:two-component system sensor histidine kinase CpxA